MHKMVLWGAGWWWALVIIAVHVQMSVLVVLWVLLQLRSMLCVRCMRAAATSCYALMHVVGGAMLRVTTKVVIIVYGSS